ncbi:MAG: alpha/beta fold hydrolase [Bacteroidia bacterium]
MKKILLLFTCLCFFVGCTKDDFEISDNLRLRYKNADMPIWIRGNSNADRIVLFLHGGPGGCAMCLRTYFQSVEKHLIVAYWDQRLAGSSGGKSHPNQLTYLQFADDLKQVVLLIKKQYPNKRLYLLGHSFGVEMAWQFLTTDNNQALVDGFIVMDGTYSTYEWLIASQKWIKNEAMIQGDKEAYDYMNNLNLTNNNMSDLVDWAVWYKYIFRLGGNPVWPSDDSGYNLKLWFFSPHSTFSNSLNSSSYDNYYDKEIFTFDRKNLLTNINIPVTIFWGEKDGIMPVEHAYQTSDLLLEKPTPIIFKNSWHSPFHTENEKFTQELIKATQ